MGRGTFLMFNCRIVSQRGNEFLLKSDEVGEPDLELFMAVNSVHCQSSWGISNMAHIDP